MTTLYFYDGPLQGVYTDVDDRDLMMGSQGSVVVPIPELFTASDPTKPGQANTGFACYNVSWHHSGRMLVGRFDRIN